MAIYIGSIAISVNHLFWALSLLFFARMLQMSMKEQGGGAVRVYATLFTLALFGIAGAFVHAVAHALYAASMLEGAASVQDIEHGMAGTLGAYSGVLLAYACVSLLTEKNYLSLAALTCAMFTGGFVARTGCVFSGCCAGNSRLAEKSMAMQWIVRNWPVLDLVSLSAAIVVVIFAIRWNATALAFAGMCLYFTLRFFFEFLRSVPGTVLSLEQWLCLGILAGVAFAWYSWYRSAATLDSEVHESPPAISVTQ